MVAYSFKQIFAPQVTALTKRQTVRADRRRHAQPGEPVQLFFGMRTRHCRKLVEPDPICLSLTPIRIITVPSPHLDLLAAIILDGRPLDHEEIEAFARADGFSVAEAGDWKMARIGIQGSARFNMGQFWQKTHGAPAVFERVVIKWEQMFK